jgi:hypothetical protein
LNVLPIPPPELAISDTVSGANALAPVASCVRARPAPQDTIAARLTSRSDERATHISEATWYTFNGGRTLGQRGSENGVIVRDAEHTGGARITLERASATAPFAITCGIYGALVHTRFFATPQEADQAFEEMKVELARILTLLLDREKTADGSERQAFRQAISAFVERFP